MNGSLVSDEIEAKKVWQEHLKNLHNVDSNEEVIVIACGFERACRNRYLGIEVITREEVVGRVRKLKNGKSAGSDGVTGEMIKNGGKCVIDWIWKLCNKAFVEGIVPKDWRRAIIVPLYKSKGDKGSCRNYRGISLLSVIRKIYMQVF